MDGTKLKQTFSSLCYRLSTVLVFAIPIYAFMFRFEPSRSVESQRLIDMTFLSVLWTYLALITIGLVFNKRFVLGVPLVVGPLAVLNYVLAMFAGMVITGNYP